MKFKIEKKKRAFGIRIARTIVLPTIVLAILIISTIDIFFATIIAPLIIFILFTFMYARQIYSEFYLIYSLNLADSLLTIEYLSGTKKRKIKTDINHLNLKFGHILSYGMNSYLKFKFTNINKEIIQFENWEWKEEDLKEVEKKITEAKKEYERSK